nr:cell wall hydrolase [Gracilibacillus halophilus]
MIKWLAISSLLVVSFISFSTISHAYTVKSGDSLWSIAQQHGVSLHELQDINNQHHSLIYPGEEITIPQAISSSDQQLMARLVHAEAKGEPYAGKVAVATVILNRVDHPDFPNTVRSVIYETYRNGSYAFSPVQNGSIHQSANAESKQAVQEAIAFRGQGKGSLFFYNPDTAVSSWIFDRETTTVIGNHRFAK